MRLRPVPARWFEAVVPRESCAYAVEALAGTGLVEIEVSGQREQRLDLGILRDQLERYHVYARKYAHFWPEPVYTAAVRDASPHQVVERALQRLAAWERDAVPSLNRLQGLRDARDEVVFWRDALRRLQDQDLDLDRIRAGGDLLRILCCCYPGEATLPGFEDVLTLPFTTEDESCLLAVVPAGQEQALNRELAQQRLVCRGLPDWLKGEEDYEKLIAHRRRWVNDEIEAVQASLEQVNERHQLAEAIGDLKRTDWLVDHVQSLESSEQFAWITGWTTAETADELDAPLREANVPGLVHFPPPPEGMSPPLLMRHRGWMRPFQIFAQALGMPGRDEADPTPILAMVVPLMFGYMFGDLGHGLVLLAVGFVLRKRSVIARLLMVGGASAMVFGLLFGSVFSLSGVIPSLWMHPLDEPVRTLAVPLIGGFVLLSLGVFINGMQTRWQHPGGALWLGDLGFFLTYAGIILALVLVDHWGLLIPVGLGMYVWAHSREGPFWPALGAALGHFVEMTLQILINTLSFVRVGAFALAHEGLNSAVSSLAAAAPHWSGFLIILILGNALVIGLEGLVVSIQTTRLVLFEFFVRFLQGTGRAFRPMPFPPNLSQGENREARS